MIRLLVLLTLLFSFPAVAQEDPLSPFARSRGKAFNPDIGVNMLGLFQNGSSITDDRTVPTHNGLSLQEAELHFSSDVDPYFRAVALLSIHQQEGSTEFAIDPEVVYAESISIPYVILRVGKQKLALGRHNQLHTHAFPFIDAPLIHQALLGDEGLNETGISAAGLLPLPWFSELTVQGFNPNNETLYNSGKSKHWGGLARYRNLWDLTDDLTLEFGASGTRARNQFSRTASVWGGDLTLKWRPSVGGKYKALIWSTEYLSGKRPGLENEAAESIQDLGGIATWLQYQFAERWWTQGRYEFLGIPHSRAIQKQNKQSALVAFIPSEFSGIRLQYDRIRTEGRQKTDHAIALQFNVSIGAHPAHEY